MDSDDYIDVETKTLDCWKGVEGSLQVVGNLNGQVGLAGILLGRKRSVRWCGRSSFHFLVLEGWRGIEALERRKQSDCLASGPEPGTSYLTGRFISPQS